MRTLLLLLVLTLVHPLAARGLEPLVVGVDPESRPFTVLDKTSFTGLDVELIRALSDVMDADAGLTAVSRGEARGALVSGRIDAYVSGLLLPAHPDPALAYSAAYLDGGLRLLVRADNTDIGGAQDLGGMIVGARLGSPAADALYELAPLAMPSLFTHIEDAVTELEKGDLDAILHDALLVDGPLSVHAHGLRAVGPVYDPRPYVIELRAGSPWKAPLDAAIATLRADGTIETLRRRWFPAPGEAPVTAPAPAKPAAK